MSFKIARPETLYPIDRLLDPIPGDEGYPERPWRKCEDSSCEARSGDSLGHYHLAGLADLRLPNEGVN